MKSISWETIKVISSSRFAKITILMPFVGWLILYNREIVEIVNFFAEEGERSSVSWQIHLFYIGMFFIGVCSIIFSMMCPDRISDFQGYADCARQTKEYITPRMCREIANRYSLREPNFNLGSPGNTEENISRADFIHYNDLVINDLLKGVYEADNQDRKPWAYLAATFFLFGSILAFIPSTYTLMWAIGEAWGQVFGYLPVK